jgi:hypothetical protein
MPLHKALPSGEQRRGGDARPLVEGGGIKHSLVDRALPRRQDARGWVQDSSERRIIRAPLAEALSALAATATRARSSLLVFTAPSSTPSRPEC